MKLIIILIAIIILYYYLNLPQSEHFTQFAPIDWATVSKGRCQELKNEMKEIETTLHVCSAPDNYGQRDNINNKVACIDAVNRQIFNSRESSSWCDIDKKSESDMKLPVDNKVANVAAVAKELPVKSELKGGILENNFDLLENTGFNGNNVSKTFATY